MQTIAKWLLAFSIFMLTMAPASRGLWAQSSPSIIGVWSDSSVYGSATHGDTYRFMSSDRFTFTFSNYRWAGRRIISFDGTYRTTDDSIYFKVDYTQELVGGRLVWSGHNYGDGWVVGGATVKRVKQPPSEAFDLPKEFRRDDHHSYIVIDGQTFVLVDRDPKAKIEK